MTIKRIAELAGVSTATVSKIINNKDENISDATRNRVLKIIEEENYVPNAVARSLKTNRTNTLGIIIPDIMNPYFAELSRAMEDEAERRGCSVILCNSDNSKEKEEKYIRILQEKMVDGIILTASDCSVIEQKGTRKVPMLVLDRVFRKEGKIGKLFIDNEKAIRMSANYLISKGCKNIAYFGSKGNDKITLDRYEGFVKIMKENNMYEEDNIYLDAYSPEAGYRMAKKLVSKDTSIDGICCANDLIAIGAMKCLMEENIKIPEEIKIIGIDGIKMGEYMTPSLTTVKQPIYKMGVGTIDIICKIIKKKKLPPLKTYDVEIFEGESA